MNQTLLCLSAAWVMLLPACGGMDLKEEPPDGPLPAADLDCPSELRCETIPAAYKIVNETTGAYGNYDLADRPADGLDIRYIVIHDTDTLFEDAIKLFQNPSNKAAAHYVIRSSDGHVVKMISPRHVAWHAGNWYYNMHSIGIEHSGWAFEGHRWYSEDMYQASAKLVRFLAERYKIPLDRAHILGHEEVPGVDMARQGRMHWDPGPFWDWEHYMQLVRGADPDERPDSGASGIIAIRPAMAENQPIPELTYCFSTDEAANCRPIPGHPVNFLYLRTAPDFAAPLITNPYLTAWPADRVFNWGNRAATGQLYYRVERQGDWDAIFFGGEKVWIHNPGLLSTRAARGITITPKAGLATAPVYGVGYPAAAAYLPPTTAQPIEKIYDLPAGQRYVAKARVSGDYYWAKSYAKDLDPARNVVVKDATEYYQIDFNHRFALVNVSDFDEIPSE